MSSWLIGLVSVIYAVASVSLLLEGKGGLALFCVGCVLANLGLILAARTT